MNWFQKLRMKLFGKDSIGVQGCVEPPMRELYIPEEYLEEFYSIRDRAMMERSELGRFRLWKLIRKALPETNEGNWHIHLTYDSRIVIIHEGELPKCKTNYRSRNWVPINRITL